MHLSFKPKLLLALAILALGSAPAWTADTASGTPDVPVDQIIDQFIQKETEFSRAREAYTYRQTVKIYEYDQSGGVRGKYESIQDIIFGPNKERTERVVYAPVSTLRNILMTPEDMEDLRNVQPFVMTNETRDEYHIRYLGDEKVDEIDCYVFSVKPKEMVKGERYFAGEIWVDKLDLQIVKTFGKGVGVLKKKQDQQFPRFETYRDQVDGKYWFPVYTRADDTLNFQTGPQKIRMIVKYEDYKRFGSEADVTFGDIIDATGESGESERAPEE